jgi:activating signal cointegrator complex subunit 1
MCAAYPTRQRYVIIMRHVVQITCMLGHIVSSSKHQHQTLSRYSPLCILTFYTSDVTTIVTSSMVLSLTCSLRHLSSALLPKPSSFNLQHITCSTISSIGQNSHYSTSSTLRLIPILKPHNTKGSMGKRKVNKGEYNDFLDGEKLRDNAEIRTSLNETSTESKISPPPTRRDGRGNWKSKGPTRPALTHFLCLPLVNSGSRPQLERNLEGFKKELEKGGLVPLKAVRPVGTLHLTLGVMALDAQQLSEVGKYLQELDLRRLLRDAIGKAGDSLEGTVSLLDNQEQDIQPLSIDLKGLIPMQARQNTSILYAEPRDATSRLYPFASALRAHFATKGFMVEDTRPLKLHATIINTIYAKVRGRPPGQASRPHPKAHDGGFAAGEVSENDTKLQEQDRSQGHGPNAKSLLKFDATDLMAQYEEFVWADNVSIERVQICKMGAKKVLDESGAVVSEEYEEVFGKAI